MTVNVTVTGAAGQIGYALLFRIASGQLLGADVPVRLRLLEIPAAVKAAEGTAMELDDSAFPLLEGVDVTDDAKRAFDGTNVALLVGARPRTKGMERGDLLEANGGIFKPQGEAINAGAASDVRVLVVGNPANTNALIARSHAPDVPAERFTAMTRLDHNRAIAQLSKRLDAAVSDVKKLTIWGNHSATQYPDVFHAEVRGQNAAQALNDATWLRDTFIQRLPGELYNLYGPTEAAIDVTSWRCEPGSVAGRARLPIGRPIQNTRLYVVDPRGEPVPAGIPGELLIGGPGVALGYLGRDELTAERFVPDRFEPGGRLYRTGDLARWREDGDLDYLGRMDRQVKLRGNRIEPGEIEAAISAHPGVARAAVVVAGTGGDRRLVAYVTPGEEPADPARLRAHLATRLPDYMIPAAFAVVDELPLTANGKVDHAALTARPLPRRPVDAPPGGGRLFDDVRAIWQEVLGTDRIGLDDDLFDLGGHSLTITQIAARMRRRLRLDVPLQVFYDTPTIRGVLAAAAGRDDG